ncbi:MAG: pyrroline-5-carboxylate reductase [Actinobacteria bacterium]|nr:pyrroline-5-carboxylate reductase [Actinomycetota bacterium]NBP53133.1 pyrroline-5-carboxylate reductase [Actinomycetota bacterium]
MVVGGISIVGGGNMGGALARGLIGAGLPATDLTIVEIDASKHSALTSLFPGATITSTIGSCKNAVIAVKPADAASATREAVGRGATTVLSIAAGVTLAKLAAAAGPGVAVIRAMPNTPALVGEGASAFALGPDCGPSAGEFAATVLGSVGLAVQVEEDLLDAVTGLTGSGPAYLFYVAEALIAGGVAEGLDPTTAESLVRQLFLGAGTLLARSSESPSRLRENVTSPNGTTAAGLAALSQAGGREAFLAAVRAATARSIELGQ